MGRTTIGTVAFREGNYEAFASAQGELADFALELEKVLEDREGMTQIKDDLHKFLFKRLQDTYEETVDYPRVPRIIEKLGEAGASAIKEISESSNTIPQVANWAINIVMIVSEACEKDIQDRDRVQFACVVALSEMAETAEANGNNNIVVEIAKKINGVCERFKKKERWHEEVKKHLSARGLQYIQTLLPSLLGVDL